MENDKLATELLHEIKATSRRWFIAFIIMCVLEIATIIGFIWYISLPIEEYEITQENDGDSNTMIGVGNYGLSESEIQTQGETQ